MESGAAKEEWVGPYVLSRANHSLSGPALAEVARAVLVRGGYFRFLAPGASMTPFIQDGDVITLAPFDPITCVLGDVVALIKPENDRLVVHRVIDISDGRCRIKGDNNPAEDGVYSFGMIIGTVTRVERNGISVRFGLGPERSLVARLSRHGLLTGFIKPVRIFYSVMGRVS